MLADRVRVSLTILLTLATAITLVATGWALTSPAVADPRPGATEAVVHAFYAAVNQTIRTGDFTALETTVAERVISHGPLAAIAPEREGLTRYLASLHATVPQVELVVTTVAATGDRAVAEVQIQGATEGTFLGTALPAVPRWGTVDAFRISNNRVLELWSEATGLALLEAQTAAPADFSDVDGHTVTLDRLTIAAEDSFVATGNDERRWLFAESRDVRVATTNVAGESAQQTSVPESKLTTLSEGELLELPTRSRTEIRNDGLDPARLLVLTVARLQATPTGPSPPQAGLGASEWWTGTEVSMRGVTVATITGTVETALPAEQAVVAVGRVTLTPGTVLADLHLVGSNLLVVDAGTLALFSDDVLAMRSGGAVVWRNAGTLAVGDEAMLRPGSRVYLHNPGSDPLVVTIFALLPADAITGGKA